MPVKAILLNTRDYSDRPKDPPPVEVVLQEMKEYCKRKNYNVVAEITSAQKYMYGRDTPLSKLILKNATGNDEIVIVKFGKNYEQVEGEAIDKELAKLVSEKRLRAEPIEHPCVSPPKNGNTRIWRYLSLPKFVDLLQSSCLHFTRVDEMQKYDASEGVSSTIAMKRFIQQVAEKKIDSPIPSLTSEQFVRIYGSSETDNAFIAHSSSSIIKATISTMSLADADLIRSKECTTDRANSCLSVKLGNFSGCSPSNCL